MTSQTIQTPARRAWPVQDAKARFSELLNACIERGPQTITRRGEDAAVLVPIDAWRRLESQRPATLKEVLLSDEGRFEMETPPRDQARWRLPERFED